MLLPTSLSGKKLSPTSHPDVRNFSSSLYATGASPAATPVLKLRGSESKSVCGLFKGSCLGLQKFFPLTQSPLVFAARSYGALSFWHWNPGLGSLVWGWDPLFLKYLSQIFIYHKWMWDQPVLYLCPSYQSGWMWFNSIVIRLLFNSISDSSE